MAAAPFGSSLILPISYAYIAMMGSEGLTEVRPAAAPCVPLLVLPPSPLCFLLDAVARMRRMSGCARVAREAVWGAQASKRAILNANYMAARLGDDYKVLLTRWGGPGGQRGPGNGSAPVFPGSPSHARPRMGLPAAKPIVTQRHPSAPPDVNIALVSARMRLSWVGPLDA